MNTRLSSPSRRIQISGTGIGVFAQWEAQYTMEAPTSGKQQAGYVEKGENGGGLS